MVSKDLKVLWQEWHVKLAVLFSLLLQALLLLLATFRKRTASTFMRYFIYAIYLLRTNVAYATFYLIVGARLFGMSDMPSGLWAAVMLLHLSGQERLTAYSIDDSNLWRSSSLSIFWQLLIHLGLFLPQRDLPLPTHVIFCLALSRLVLRAFRLRMGTQETTVPGVVPFGDLEVAQNQQLMMSMVNTDNGDYSLIVWRAHCLLKTSLRLIADAKCCHDVVHQVRDFFLHITDPNYAIRITEIELNFIYESFHTDGTIRKHLNNNWNIIYASVRSIESLFCVLALISFMLKSSDLSRIDYFITNLLLWGTVTLELISFIFTVFSDWTIAALRSGNDSQIIVAEKLFQVVPQRRGWWSDYPIYKTAPRWVKLARNLFRRWSETLFGFNFVSYCIQTRSLGQKSKECMRQLDELTGTQNLITSFRFVSNDWYSDELGKFVFKELQKRPREILFSLKNNVWLTDESYNTSVLAWHITTEVLYNLTADHQQQDGSEHCRYSKILSDYMAYLLYMKPHFLAKTRSCNNPLRKSESAEIYIQKLAEPEQGEKFEDYLKRCCLGILHLNLPDVLHDNYYVQSLCLAISKVSELGDFRLGEKNSQLWCKISEEWVDILLYAASKYDELEHVRGLCHGGEFISIVWLLAFHLGLFQKEMASSSTT